MSAMTGQANACVICAIISNADTDVQTTGPPSDR